MILLFVLLFALCARAQSDGSVIVTGFGKTPDEAKYNAFTTAIEQTLGVMVSSDMLIENGELITDKIRSNSQGYIESYTIISTGKDKDLHVVTIRAVVAKKKIQTQLDEITHVNDSKMSYDAVKCWSTPAGTMCKGGDLAMGNMNFGIYDASFAMTRFYTSPDLTEAQVYVSLTLREKGYFHEATDQNGAKYELRYVYMGSEPPPFNAKTITEDFIIPMSLKTLKSFEGPGLEMKLKGSKKEVTVRIPGAYIEGFAKYIEDNL